MVAKHLASPEQAEIWLSPSAALTRFRPPDMQNTIVATTHAETFFGFRVGRLAFLISALTYCEVIEHLTVNPLPNVDPWFSGLLNLRGNLVPVIDLQVLFAEAVTTTKRQLFVIDRGEKAMAIWIDALPEIHNLSTPALKQLPSLPPLLERCVVSGHLHADLIWLNVQFDTLFKALGDAYAT